MPGMNEEDDDDDSCEESKLLLCSVCCSFLLQSVARSDEAQGSQQLPLLAIQAAVGGSPCVLGDTIAATLRHHRTRIVWIGCGQVQSTRQNQSAFPTSACA